MFAAVAGDLVEDEAEVSMGIGTEGALSAADEVSEELREAGGELWPSEASTERARGFKSWSTSTLRGRWPRGDGGGGGGAGWKSVEELRRSLRRGWPNSQKARTGSEEVETWA
jgi:hypothetical protein